MAAVQSDALDRAHGFAPGHIARHSGVDRRGRAQGRSQIDLAIEAGQAALADAGLEAVALDAILHCAAVPYQTLPATAPLVQGGLGLAGGQVAAFDIGATCLGFLAGLQHAAAMVEAGRWTRILVVSAEAVGDFLDWRDPATAGLFGDGAGAAVVGTQAGPKLGSLRVGRIALETHPSGYHAAEIRAGGTRLGQDATQADMQFTMDGRALFALTRRHFGRFVGDMLAVDGLTLDALDVIVPHQASPSALGLMAAALKVPKARLVDLSVNHGNLVAASLPVTLDHARRAGLIAPGARVLMLGTAAGVTFGAALLEAGPSD
ncbi:MAG: 3-oxoacyl-[acyl-carrier-protein] synthase III C-terminal domain-containing protein [Pseudomonadota bacterium]